MPTLKYSCEMSGTYDESFFSFSLRNNIIVLSKVKKFEQPGTLTPEELVMELERLFELRKKCKICF